MSPLGTFLRGVSRLAALALSAATVAAGASCTSATTTALEPSPLKCQAALSAPGSTLAAEGSTGTLVVSAQPECAWTAGTTVSWISVSPVSGQGSGTLNFQVASNPQPSPRQGDITLNDATVRLTQAAALPCLFTIAPGGQAFGPTGGTGEVTVTTTAACAWTATPTAPWIVVTQGTTGSGTGIVEFRVASNAGPARSGSITIGNQSFAIDQAAATPGVCSYALSAASMTVPSGGGSREVSLQTTASCTWSAASAVPWIAITSPASGTGSATIAFTVQPNTGPARTGTLTIGSEIVTVQQPSACAFAIAPTSQSVGAGGGAGAPIAVTATDGCGWTAATNVSWLTITSDPAGTGNGTVTFAVAANAGTARTGTLTIAGLTFTVNQAAACSYVIQPTSASVGSVASAGNSIAVNTQAGCAWTATSDATWITVTAGGSGTGNGTVTFSVTANTGAARTGTVTVAGHAFTVSQAGTCTYAIDPASQSVGTAASSGHSIAVTATSGCSWTAVSNAAWITVTSGASGTGNGAVTFSVAANSGAPRTGTLTVAGRTFTVSQAGTCTFTIDPASASIDENGGTIGPIAVTTASTCAWTAVSNDSWIAVASGASGTGPGNVSLTVSSYNGASRTGTVTIGGVTFTVTQTKK